MPSSDEGTAKVTGCKRPVVIVGAGPVGLALAGELGWRGIECLLVEKTDGAIFQPRMDLVGVRTMEFCRRWGIVPWVEASPYTRSYKQDCLWVSSVVGWEFGREKFPGMADELPPPQSPQHRERCPQDMFDPILKRFAGSFPQVELRYRTELLSFVEHEDGVTATLRDLATGATETVETEFLVGCDGAASTVRQGLGIAMAGNPVLTYTTNVLFRTSDFLSLHDKGEAYRFIVIGPEGTLATIVAINGADRFRFSMVGDAQKRTYSEEEIRAAIVKAVGREFDFEILSIMPWIRRELVAESYGTKRVFLAGDAVHLNSPTGAFGMNTGIQDAVDLGWKLAARLDGWGGPGLLAAYEIERRPVAIRNVKEASNNLSRMLSARDRKPPTAAFEPGLKGDRAREEFGRRYTEIMRHEWFTLGVHLGYRYEGSPIVVPDGTPESPDDYSNYVQTARPGHRAPHVWLSPGVSTLDLFGRGFVLLRLGADPLDCDGLVAAAASRGVPLTLYDIEDPAVQAQYEYRLVLVRPDGHVAWRADAVPDDPLAVIEAVRGAQI
ncbi:MAG: Salicylate hydroxylase [Rhodospirillales bacterium]|nr:Salicylate hydroxylase [Rhodospirillales bacterium]